MNDINASEPARFDAAKTQELRPLVIDEQKLREGQEKVREMIAANAPLSEILESLVLMIESQSPDMLCSVLLLSDDGNHMRHGAAPRPSLRRHRSAGRSTLAASPDPSHSFHHPRTQRARFGAPQPDCQHENEKADRACDQTM